MTPHELSTWPRGLPRDIDIPPTNLCANLLVSAMRSPRRAVLVDDFGSLAYAELVEQVERIAAFLQNELGVQRGDRVLLCLQNGRGWVAAYYAVLRINAVVVPVNPMNKRDELPHYLSDTGAVAAFCGSDNVAELLAVPAAQQLRRVIIVGSPGPADVPADTVAEGAGNLGNPARTIGLRRVLATAPGPLAPLEHLPDALALILYSSGSTGAPKGCMHTHRTLTASTVIVAHWMGLVPHSVQLVALPYFHITGMQNLLNAPIYGGGTLVLMKRWNRDEAAALIARHQVSHWTAMPTMVIDFLASPRLAEYDLRSVRRIGGGGAGMPEAVGERLKALTGLDFLEGYGLSETAHVSGNPPAAFKRQCLGVPLFNTDLRVIDPDTSAELPPGEVGEIVMAGPQVFTGYWRNEEATRNATLVLDGKRFVRSGDLGRRDEEGYFFIVDRLKRMVNASGFKVWPAEVEAMLHEHPAIAEACVIAAVDAYRGETVKAVVVLREGQGARVREADIVEWAKQKMAAYKYPRLVEFVAELPKTATGKIAWRQLQEAERAKALRAAA
ncbi:MULTISPECIES: long-chain-fatty-acid--CoA ligase [unclassified Variovorax]|uniref:long-chain-fatty-acid--CoA ligase n=1 Tax=unclassified Variovorax TaxID=663243 RepID=UPI0008B8D93F|nr:MULTISPECIES: long-chain-fatty-acid--CoA ligase [unclassified Variovorax]SEK15029.1 fatty-acyl-CoA synthase [Variovorax sp. OK202]SFE07700.1 fatty-acyl-CoA synthase [Variovorax sp. OK212]